jgi:hypothetical protein
MSASVLSVGGHVRYQTLTPHDISSAFTTQQPRDEGGLMLMLQQYLHTYSRINRSQLAVCYHSDISDTYTSQQNLRR